MIKVKEETSAEAPKNFEETLKLDAFNAFVIRQNR